MNRMISLARIAFAGLGLYLLSGLALGLLSTIGHIFLLFSVEFSWKNLWAVSLSTLMMLALAAAVIIFLFIKSESTARKLIGKDFGSEEPLDINLTLTMAFRIVCAGAGIFFMRSFVSTAFNAFNRILLYRQLTDQSNAFTKAFFKNLNMELLQSALILALIIYLICGAPHFVRWQVKKTLKLCEDK